MAASGRTASTQTTEKDLRQYQHLKETEASLRTLDSWLRSADRQVPRKLAARLRPITGDSDVMELQLIDESGVKCANTIFVVLWDRQGRSILVIREINLFDSKLEGGPALALAHLFLINRYHVFRVQFLSPGPQEAEQSWELEKLRVLVGIEMQPTQFIVGEVDAARVAEFLATEAEIGFSYSKK